MSFPLHIPSRHPFDMEEEPPSFDGEESATVGLLSWRFVTIPPPSNLLSSSWPPKSQQWGEDQRQRVFFTSFALRNPHDNSTISISRKEYLELWSWLQWRLSQLRRFRAYTETETLILKGDLTEEYLDFARLFDNEIRAVIACLNNILDTFDFLWQAEHDELPHQVWMRNQAEKDFRRLNNVAMNMRLAERCKELEFYEPISSLVNRAYNESINPGIPSTVLNFLKARKAGWMTLATKETYRQIFESPQAPQVPRGALVPPIPRSQTVYQGLAATEAAQTRPSQPVEPASTIAVPRHSPSFTRT